LHYASSVHHTMCQEITSIVMREIWSNCSPLAISITVAQGSDDYASLISIPYHKDLMPKLLRLVYRLIRFRARLSHLTGIIDSDKTAPCILDILEYNSEWSISRSITRPTLKWVIASMEVNLVENFVTRLRQFNNNLTQVLEGGASTLECSLIQLSQAWLHYKLLGIDQHLHFYSFKDLILKVPDPAAGFFPLEADILCGLTGLDYVFYHLAKNTGYGSILASIETMAEAGNIDYNGRKSKTLGEETRNVILKFSDPKKWQKTVAASGLPSYDECIQYFNENPEVAFTGHTSWTEDRMSVALKFYSPGVRSSLSGQQPLLRMMVASSYILNRPCLSFHQKTIHDQIERKKFTLLQILRIKEREYFVRKGEEEIIQGLKSVFPKWEEYDKMANFEKETNRNMFLEESSFRRRGKVLLEVFPDANEDQYPLIALCNRQWFDKKFAVKVGSVLFKELWEIAKKKYLFIRDTVQETMEVSSLNVVQLKFYLEATTTKGRKVKLMDTSAKGGTLQSTITRIFWDTIKIRTHREASVDESISSLKSVLFSVINFPYQPWYKEFLIADILKAADCLKKPEEEISSEGQTLKLIRDVLTESISREMAVSKITRLKDGAVGWFSIRQGFDKSSGKRTGPGEWRGKIGRISCILTLESIFVTRVTLNTFDNQDQIVISLKRLMADLKLKPAATTHVSPQGFYYRPNKNFIKANLPPEGCIAAIKEPTLLIDRFESVEKTNWKIDTTPYALRLINIDHTGIKAVLLTERISSKYWDKDSFWPLEKDSILHYWHRGKPLPFSEWHNWAESILVDNPHSLDFRSQIRTLRRRNSTCFYDLLRFESLFCAFFQDESQSFEDRRALIDLDSRREVMDETFLNIDITENVVLNELRSIDEGAQWSSNTFEVLLEQASDLDLDMGNVETAEAAAEMLKSFADGIDSVPQEILDELTVGMPMSNNFFAILLGGLNSAFANVDLENLLQNEMVFEAPFGKILSLLSGKDKRYHEDFEDDVKAGDIISTIMSSIGDGSRISSIERQESLIQDLISSLPGSKGIVYSMLSNKLRKEQARLNSMKMAENGVLHPDDFRDFKKQELTISFSDALADNGEPFVHRDIACLDPQVYWIKIQAALHQHVADYADVGELEEETLLKWIEAIKGHFPTSDYWAILADISEADIVFADGEKELYREPCSGPLGSQRVAWVYDLLRGSWAKRENFISA
jgi:hypothetical protein